METSDLSQHISRRFNEDLERVRSQVLNMGGFVEQQLAKAVTALVEGDSLSLSIAAASIIAKVTRDRLMVELDGEFPQYGFARHKGYGVREHLEALRNHGPCPAHRRTFQPVAQTRFAL